MLNFINGGVCAAQGFRAAGVHAGVKTHAAWKKDVALIVSDVDCAAAAVFTKNVVKAAPIHVDLQHLKNGRARAVIANSGNANACAPQGEENAERMCAAVAGAIASGSDPALPLGGAELRGLPGLDGQYRDGELDVLILGGVTPAESLSGRVSVVRGVTTRTTTGGAADATWRELAMVRIVDNVIPSLRDALRSKFQRAKNTPQSRSAIRAQCVRDGGQHGPHPMLGGLLLRRRPWTEPDLAHRPYLGVGARKKSAPPSGGGGEI